MDFFLIFVGICARQSLSKVSSLRLESIIVLTETMSVTAHMKEIWEADSQICQQY